ncbi:uncharacterized protein A1O5_12480 [Cladophialophora psammophila CBS 110553]|uniref:RBR-type E3 ubiquitin transferase n=1 Tax=Cladophialophora psammophila CBS 110553 TaxID=1182543 RepID=W9VY90_9EURO|nr:uncharacterized protein A1O5_12480 [Cladophialophora psammophila CBS 110553]EXJ57690.1 hypothetical protein A1O5_12480 [Cladophialophora psammophila CBS 110553]
MAGQGPTALSTRSVNFHPTSPSNECNPPFRNSEGYLGFNVVRIGENAQGEALYDWIFAFSTAADASNVLLSDPQVPIGDRLYRLGTYDGHFGEPQFDLSEPSRTRDSLAPPPPPPSDISPPRKRLKKSPPNKVTCKICFGDIEGVYSTPCRRCKEALCYECLKTLFDTAMKNMDRMPVMCCQAVMHHEVARGILPAAELEKYKERCDEINTVDPLYCPVPACSAFIPPRMLKETDTTVTCHVCKTTICTKCKQYAGAKGHACVKDESQQFILKTYEYKLCPKCRTGVMKMYGCPHVRCRCGAHWCWDCRRSMNACYKYPCRAARDDGVDGEDEEPESNEEEGANGASTSAPVPTEVEASLQAQATQSHAVLRSATDTHGQIQEDTVVHQAATEESAEAENIQDNEITQALTADQPTSDPNGPEATASAPENLDDPEENDWENEDMFFGEEPIDEAWDTWGCRHHFNEFGKDRIPRFWLVDFNHATDVSLEIECMGCFEKVEVGKGEIKKAGFKEKWCHWKPSGPTEESESEAQAVVDGRTTTSADKSRVSFECRHCGVIYCGPCKRAARKKMAREYEAPDADH